MEKLELEAAVTRLVTAINPQTKTKTIPLIQALNHHLAHDVYATINVPSFNRSAMDGYGVKAKHTEGATKETPIKLKVRTQLTAGRYLKGHIDQKEAVRVMTGAHLPDGLDAVIKQEATNLGEDEVEIYQSVLANANYIKMGEDIQKGQLVIKKFTRLTAIHLGILASLGINEVKVLQPLKVGLISSGCELIKPGIPLASGQIYDSNRYVLAAKLRSLNVDVVFAKQLPDHLNELCTCIQQAINQVDLLMTTGGVSVGKKDLMHDVIKNLGAKRLFWRVNIRPGTPALASIYRDKPILSLSGHPFAALTSFELLFRPMLATFMKTEDYTCHRKQAVLMNDFNKVSKQRRFVRAYYEEGQVFLTTSSHESSVLSNLLGCNCFVDIKANTPKLQQGEKVEVVLFT